MKLRNAQDILEIESRGFEKFVPHRSAWAIIKHQASQRPDAVALEFLHDCSAPERDELVTFSQLANRIEAAAWVFQRAGVGPDKAVAVLTQHTISGQIALWGAQLVGRACPINPMLKPEAIAGLIRAANAAAVVITGVSDEVSYWKTLVPGLRAEGIEVPIFCCDADRASPDHDGIFEDLVAAAPEGQKVEVWGDDQSIAALYHTGGTTGQPKLVRHRRQNQAHVAHACAAMYDFGPDDKMLNGFPLFHVAGAFVFGLSALSAGSRLVIPGRLGMRNQGFMREVWQQVERRGITKIGAVPTVLAALNSTPVDANIATLRFLLTGGSPLPTELAEAVETHAGVPVRNILGMTESAGAIAAEPVQGPRTPLSCGLRLPFSEVAVFGETDGDVDSGKRLPAGETGIIATRGPNVADGYSQASRNPGTFLPKGWLVTGDLGSIDATGCLFITGRKKDVIIRSAHNIDPQMIEDALLAHPKVETAAAVGMPDAYAGELPIAFIVTRDHWAPDLQELLNFLAERIEDPLAIPKRIHVIDEMPMTPVGKIFKPALRSEAIRAALDLVLGDLARVVRVTLDEENSVTIHAPDDSKALISERLVGMPLTLSFAPIGKA